MKASSAPALVLIDVQRGIDEGDHWLDWTELYIHQGWCIRFHYLIWQVSMRR